MKKILAKISAFSALAVLLPSLALASSFSVIPQIIKANPGKTFILTLNAVPDGTRMYTAKAEVEFPADLVEVKSFSFAPGWMPLVQPGYDSIDNAKGKMEKTAGYAGGIGKTAAFGTVVFSAKKTGAGKIEVGKNSLILDINSKNVYVPGSLHSASLAVETAPVPAPKPVSAPKPEAEPSPQPITPSPIEPAAEIEPQTQPTIVSEPINLLAPEKISTLASVRYGFSLGTNNIFVGVLVTMILLSLLLIIPYSHYLHAKKETEK